MCTEQSSRPIAGWLHLMSGDAPFFFGRERPPKHGGEFVFGDPATWGTEHVLTTTDTRLYGRTTAQVWNRLHLG